jgi:hypothetical protein
VLTEFLFDALMGRDLCVHVDNFSISIADYKGVKRTGLTHDEVKWWAFMIEMNHWVL